jgi:hypothetical protein
METGWNRDKLSGFSQLASGQIRQTIDTEQVFDEWSRVAADNDHRFKGAMSWKTIAGKKYLYRKTGSVWKSLGPQSDATELMYRQFHEGRDEARRRLQSLSSRLDDLAAVNRAMRIGRLPLLTARLIRSLGRLGLIGTAFDVVGTNALYVYERMAGIRIDSGLVATADIDLMFDARTKLTLIGKGSGPSSLVAILQSVDRSFHPTGRSSFRAANQDGFLVDLIMPLAGNRLQRAGRTGISGDGDDLVAVEIEGLQWLVNSPKVELALIDERGYPVRCSAPDPRSFAIHKLWLAEREDRDPLKRTRDRRQADLVREIVANFLPHLGFDDPALGALPKALRSRLVANLDDTSSEPRW